MTPEEFLAASLRQFAVEFVRNRKADVLRRDMTNTEALLRSLYAKVNADPQRGQFMMLVFFRNYGRYPDMNRQYTKAGGREMIALLKEWAKKEGLGKFNRGRFAQFSDESPERTANRIAWGIVRKLPTLNRAKKKGWYNRGKTRDIEIFYDEMLRGYADAVRDQAAAAFAGQKA